MPTIASRPANEDARQPASRPPATRQPARIRPSGESPHRGPTHQLFYAPPIPPSPSRELARRALDVLRRARLASPPERWLQPAFGREVDLVRLHLAPVRTRAGLASSFGREAFNLAVDDWPVRAAAPETRSTDAMSSIGPVHVAYAMRWLELGDGRRRAAFRDWLADALRRRLR